MDLWMIKFVSGIYNPVLDVIMTKASFLGNGGLIWIDLGLILLISKKTRKYGIYLFIILGVNALAGEVIIKNIVKRPRPFTAIEGLRIITKLPVSYSFPSGHTASSFAVFGMFYFLKLKYRWIIFIMAALIAFSRIYLNLHYTTDVIGGIILGLTVSYIICRFIPKADKAL